MNKKGMSGDIILQIGLIAIAGFTTLMAVNVFYDSVETAAMGDAYLSAKTMASYADFVDASAIPITVYHEIPQDFMGNPGYGTVLYDPDTCEFRVNKYPQDYMSNLILNHAWETVTIEEGLGVLALSKYNKAIRKASYSAGAKIAGKSGNIPVEELFEQERALIENDEWVKSIERQGYTMDEISEAAVKLEKERLAKLGEKELREEAAMLASDPAFASEMGFHWNENAGRYKNNADGKFMTHSEGDRLTREFLENRFEPDNLNYKKGGNKNAQRNLRHAFDTIGIDPNGKVGLLKKVPGGGKLNVHALNGAGKNTVLKTGLFSRAKRSVVSSRLVSLVKLPYHIIKYPFKQVAKNAKIYGKAIQTVYKKELREKALKRFVKRLSKSAIRSGVTNSALGATNKACRAVPFPGNVACFVGTYGISMISYAMEYAWTYLPIYHFIGRSQDATAAINREWASVSCLSKPDRTVVTKPNCESDSELDYPDFGEALFLDEFAEAIFAMPSSKVVPEIKEYEGITNKGDVCVDSHNYLLSEKTDIIGDKYVDPRTAIATIPFASCAVASTIGMLIGKSEWGPGCTTAYAVLYLSNWVDPNTSIGEDAAFIGSMAFLAGPAAIPLSAAFIANPIDSRTFFPYVSKSAGMIDTNRYYYIENPSLITISKYYEDGELVMEISKEL